MLESMLFVTLLWWMIVCNMLINLKLPHFITIESSSKESISRLICEKEGEEEEEEEERWIYFVDVQQTEYTLFSIAQCRLLSRVFTCVVALFCSSLSDHHACVTVSSFVPHFNLFYFNGTAYHRRSQRLSKYWWKTVSIMQFVVTSICKVSHQEANKNPINVVREPTACTCELHWFNFQSTANSSNSCSRIYEKVDAWTSKILRRRMHKKCVVQRTSAARISHRFFLSRSLARNRMTRPESKNSLEKVRNHRAI
jgi:hypothetical protein